jgi:hypothetical protein
MDTDSQRAIEILEAIASSNAKLTNLAQLLQGSHEVIRVVNSLECRKYQTGSMLEGFVDVELRNGNALCWNLEISWNDESWKIDTRILINDPKGQITVHKFNDRTANTMKEFLELLGEAVEELTQYDGLKLGNTEE